MTAERTSFRHFSELTTAPPDPVFGLAEQFRHDPHPQKVNLTVGAYQDEGGSTPVMRCVKRAEESLLATQATKNYQPIDGLANFRNQVQRLILGNDHEAVATSRAATIQSPGGTGALRLAADFFKNTLGRTRIWISDPTWANHPQIFRAAGLDVQHYRYLTEDQTQLDLPAISEKLETAQPGDVVLFHTICHNPTGFDLDRDGWLAVLELVERRGLIPLFDFAYQGFGTDIETDAWPIRHFCHELPEVFVCNSFSKNMGMYSERVGGLTVVMPSSASALAALSHIKQIVRTIYSTPPEHGGAVAAQILGDSELRRIWLEELDSMRLRIRMIREQFAEALAQTVPQRDFSFMKRQCGMFSYSGLTRAQVIRLREEFSIYLVESGRINIAGINHNNIERVCQAMAAVV